MAGAISANVTPICMRDSATFFRVFYVAVPIFRFYATPFLVILIPAGYFTMEDDKIYQVGSNIQEKATVIRKVLNNETCAIAESDMLIRGGALCAWYAPRFPMVSSFSCSMLSPC